MRFLVVAEDLVVVAVVVRAVDLVAAAELALRKVALLRVNADVANDESVAPDDAADDAVVLEQMLP